MAAMPVERMTAAELHQAFCLAVTKGDPAPSLDRCKNLLFLVPLPPDELLLGRVERPIPKRARTNAVALRNALPELRQYWRDFLANTAIPQDADPEVHAVIQRQFAKHFEAIDALERALAIAIETAIPVAMVVGARSQDWHDAARGLRTVFDRGIINGGRGSPYGVSSNGPTDRFVRSCLQRLGWTTVARGDAIRKLFERDDAASAHES